MRTTDAEARARIREDLTTSFLVEAAAGTGKTTETVHRVVSAVAAGRVESSGLVALSFTRKAAGELSLRLRRALERAAHARSGVEARRLRHALVHLDEAHLGTIHGFCAELLRRHPVEAGIDPEFEGLDGDQAKVLYQEVFRTWFERQLTQPDPRFRRALAHGQTYAFNDQGPWEQLVRAGWDLVEARHRVAESWPHRGTDWTAAIRDFGDRAAALGRAYGQREPGLAASLTKKDFDALIEFGERTRSLPPSEWDPATLEAALQGVMRFKAPPRRGRIGEQSAAELAHEAEALGEAWSALRADLDPDFAAELRDLLGETVELFEARKRRLGKLDNLDLLLKCRALVEQDAVRDRVRAELQLVFVDEFQDTDPLQAHIVERVARVEDGGLFIVGDPKQSIYGFRSADIDFYRAFAQELAHRGVEKLTLSHSFRALGPIQDFVNAAFEPAFEGEVTQPDYVPIQGGPSPSEGTPPPLLAFTPGRQDILKVSFTQGRWLSGKTTARLIEWILNESGWKVRDPEDPEGALVPVRAEHIGVLVRRMKEYDAPEAWVRSLVRELQRRHVPWLLHQRRYLDDRTDVAGVFACLMAIEWPNDPYWAYAALRSPLFHFSDDVLAEWLARVGPLHPSTALPAAEPRFEALADALRLFDELSQKRNERSVTATIEALLGATRAVAGFAHELSGPEAVAGLRGILGLAETHERRDQSAFRTFVERLENVGPSTLAEQQLDANGVRILNVHQAKGLEFPIVILGDPYDQLKKEVERVVEDDRPYFSLLGFRPAPLRRVEPAEGLGEELRIAYVAATRARDSLIVAAKAAGPFKPIWTGPIESAIEPHADAEPEPSPFWPHGEPCCVLKKGRAPLLSGRRLGPGGVVDWAPSSLFDRPNSSVPVLRRRDVLEEGDGAALSIEAHQAWQLARKRRLQEGGAASLVLLRPSDAEDEPKRGMARRVRMVRVQQEPGRPRGRRFGHLVHEVMRHAFDASLEVALDAGARQIDATDEEREAAKMAVERALADPLLTEARSSRRRETELPVCRMNDEGLLLDGVIDLFFEDESGRGVVLDYKTHEELDENEAKRQIAWYLWALEPEHAAGLRGVVFVL